MGPKGPTGVVMKMCTQAGAHSTYCTDECGGQYGDHGDNFLYRYYIQGDLSDGVSNKLNPLPGAEYFPHTPLCFVGCIPTGVTGTVFATASNSGNQPSLLTPLVNPGLALAGFSLPACPAGAVTGVTGSYNPSAKILTAPGVYNSPNSVSACDSEENFASLYTGNVCLTCGTGCCDCVGKLSSTTSCPVSSTSTSSCSSSGSSSSSSDDGSTTIIAVVAAVGGVVVLGAGGFWMMSGASSAKMSTAPAPELKDQSL